MVHGRRARRPPAVPEVLGRLAPLSITHGLPTSEDLECFEPGGCPRCNGSGHRGRTGLYEVMVLDERLRSLILDRRPVDELAAAAVESGMRRMADHALDEVAAGNVSCTEAARVLGSTAR